MNSRIEVSTSGVFDKGGSNDADVVCLSQNLDLHDQRSNDHLHDYYGILPQAILTVYLTTLVVQGVLGAKRNELRSKKWWRTRACCTIIGAALGG